MLKRKATVARTALVVSFVVLSTCSYHAFLRPNPPSSPNGKPPKNRSIETPLPDPSDTTANLDFAEALDTATFIDSTITPPPQQQSVNDTTVASDNGSYLVPTGNVRVSVIRSTKSLVIYTAENALIYEKKRKPLQVRGRVLIEASHTAQSVKISNGSTKTEFALPCTLGSINSYNFFDAGDCSYRGILVVISAASGRISLVNILGVEDYLRGVLPIEMGKRTADEIEALKAQAVAARTYTYRRIFERTKEPFDLINTVADQVYGGASAEDREADAAIRATRNLLLVYGGKIIYAYYHSTCGGRTATISDVWNKQFEPYLRSVSDVDNTGKAYCAFSGAFNWEASWSNKEFSSTVLGSLAKMFPNKTFTGTTVDVQILDRFPCGRVKMATFTGNGWEHTCGGDALRFIMRRAVSGHPILQSSNFAFSRRPGKVLCKGTGYGHGVGLCQMGALGRARAGQKFDAILKAYYSGVAIVAATTTPEKTQ